MYIWVILSQNFEEMLLLTICLIFAPKSLKYIHITTFYSKSLLSYNCKLTWAVRGGCSITLLSPVESEWWTWESSSSPKSRDGAFFFKCTIQFFQYVHRIAAITTIKLEHSSPYKDTSYPLAVTRLPHLFLPTSVGNHQSTLSCLFWTFDISEIIQQVAFCV